MQNNSCSIRLDHRQLAEQPHKFLYFTEKYLQRRINLFPDINKDKKANFTKLSLFSSHL